LRIAVEKELPANDALGRAWNNLVMQMERPEVFYTYEWALAVQCAYPQRFRPLVMLGFEEETLAAAVSLASDREQGDQVVFLAATTADYCDFLSAPERRDAWISAVLGELRKLGISRLTLANMPAHSRSVVAIRNLARKEGYFQYARPGYLCAQVKLGDSKQRAIIAQNISSKKMLRRTMRAMEKAGGARLCTETTWTEIEPALKEFTIAHVARFLESGRISNLAPPERRSFIYELAKRLSSNGWMALSRLTLEGKSIAWNYGFQFGGSWFWYQPTFDSEYEHFSPGYCLLVKIVEAACQRPELTAVDLGLGEEEYKARFATSGCQTLHLSLSSSPKTQLGTIVQYRLASALRHSPPLEKFARTLRSQLAALRNRIRGRSWPAILRSCASRGWHLWFGSDSVLFFEHEHTAPRPQSTDNEESIEPLTLKLLAAAALHYHDDEETQSYLLRSAKRLQAKTAQGFVLTRCGVPVHFAWVTDFEGFDIAELKTRLVSPANNAKLIFDCWTPGPLRGRGYYSQTISGLVADLHEQHQKPWIFGAAANGASLKGTRKAGFHYRFTLSRRRIFGVSRLTRTCVASPASVGPYALEAAAGKT
jgi:CelD/BcsL family acetyltransferase involved in cellulose biosynthesis